MPSDLTIQRSFLAGELAPAMGARADLKAYTSGLALCSNFWIKREGGVVNRPGSRFVHEVKDSTKFSKFIPFIFEGNDQTYLIEVAAGVFRFYWHGGIVLSGLSPYEVANPYAEADLRALQWAQSADVLTLTHKGYAPRELRRLAHTSWSLVTITTAMGIDAPASLTGSPALAGSKTLRYVVTALKTDTYEESAASSLLAMAGADFPTIDDPQEITWPAVSDAAEYNVYKDEWGNGVFGFIGKAAGTLFVDPGFTPDYTKTPPVDRSLMGVLTDYPACSTYYQQRRFFANTGSNPELVRASRIGSFANFSISTPLQDDDAVEFTIASRELNPVHHLVPLTRLLLLSDAAAWIIRGDAVNGTITPSSINADPTAYVGSHPNVRPVVVGNAVLYVQSRGAAVRDLRFEAAPSTLGGRDLTIFASHLFEGHTLKALAYQQQPTSILWAVRDDGVLLACTYLPDEDVVAWSQHDLCGVVEEVAVLPDTTAGYDTVYVIVRRTISGATKRYIEKLESRFVAKDGSASVRHLAMFFVDCGLTYNGAAATVMTGLDHLEGEVVAVLADGAVVYDGDPDGAAAATYTVTGGQITLPAAASVVHIGLRIVADLETLAVDVEGSAVRGRMKRVQGVELLLEDSDPYFYAGPDEDHLERAKRASWDATTAVSDGVEIQTMSRFGKGGKLRIRHQRPTPLEVLGILPLVELGG